jgi:hypothetical protein
VHQQRVVGGEAPCTAGTFERGFLLQLRLFGGRSGLLRPFGGHWPCWNRKLGFAERFRSNTPANKTKEMLDSSESRQTHLRFLASGGCTFQLSKETRVRDRFFVLTCIIRGSQTGPLARAPSTRTGTAICTPLAWKLKATAGRIFS